MRFSRSFKFLDDDLSQRLRVLLKKSGLPHAVDPDGTILYAADDEEIMGNDLISSVRDQAFPSWQTLTCPPDWVQRYRDHMTRHRVPYVEEMSNATVGFLLPRKYRPHAWKLE